MNIFSVNGFILFICFLSWNLPGFNQNITLQKPSGSSLFEWTEMPYFTSTLNTATQTADGSWILGGVYANTSSFMIPPVVIKLSATGQKEWQYPQGYFEWELGVTTVVKNATDGNILAGGWCLPGCDYGPFGLFLHKISPEGSVIWKKIYVTDNGGTDEMDVMESRNGNIYLLSRNQLLIISPAGDSLDLKNYSMPLTDYLSAGLAGDDFLLLGHSSGIYKTDPDGNILNIFDFEGQVRNVYKTGTGYNFISGNQVIKTDFELNTLDTYDFSNLIPGDYHASVNGDHLIITGNGHIVQFDSDIQLIADDPYEIPDDFKVNAFSAGNGLLMMAGSQTGAAGDEAMAAKTFLWDGTTLNFNADAEITGLRVENVTAVPGYYPGLYDFQWDGYATIKNHSTETMNTVDLVSKMFNQGICSNWSYLIHIDNMALAPGGSVELPCGPIAEYYMFLPGQTQANYTWKVHSMRPEGLLDRNTTNDEASVTFMVDLGVGIDDQNQENFGVYPNPANQYVIIHSHSVSGFNWKIVTIDGIIVKQGYADNVEMVVDLSGIRPGLYFIETGRNEYKSLSQKLLIFK